MSTPPQSIDFAVGQVWLGERHPTMGAMRRRILVVEPERVRWEDADDVEYVCWQAKEPFASWARSLEAAR